MAEEGPNASHYFGRRLPPGLAAAARPAPGDLAVAREPLSRAPWPPLALAASLVAAFAIQSLSGDAQAWNARWGLTPQALLEGRALFTLATHLWSHASWMHVLTNAVCCLAFGAPVARLFGLGARGAALFVLLYMAGGVVSSAGYALLQRPGDTVLVGASGAICAFIGASSRLLTPLRSGEEGAPVRRLAPMLSPPVLTMSAAFVAINLILGLLSVDAGPGEAPVAWETHLFGYAAGLLLVGPLARLAAGPPPAPAPRG